MMAVAVVVAMVTTVVTAMLVVIVVVVEAATVVVITWPRGVLNAGYGSFPRRFGICIYITTDPIPPRPSNATSSDNACPH